MEIKRIGQKAILINSRYAKILAFSEEFSDEKINSISPDIVLGRQIANKFSIYLPGEYETHEVWFMGFQSNVSKNNVDIYVLNVDSVRVAIIYPDVCTLNKKQIEKIGIIDILVADLSAKLEILVQVISEIDPRILIPVNDDKESLNQLIKSLGVKNITEDKKLKFSEELFTNEEYQLELKKLTF